MSRFMTLLIAAVVWGTLDHINGNSLKPLFSQIIFGANVLMLHWWLNN